MNTSDKEIFALFKWQIWGLSAFYLLLSIGGFIFGLITSPTDGIIYSSIGVSGILLITALKSVNHLLNSFQKRLELLEKSSEPEADAE